MKIYFVDPEAFEQHYFEEGLKTHDLCFLSAEEEVPDDAEILSIFINTEITPAFLQAHEHLRFIATRSSTVDHIDLDACSRRGVMVSRVPTYGDHTVAEHTFALILAVSRRLREAMAFDPKLFSYEALRGWQVRGKTLGVIGVGRVGLRVLELARGLHMHRIAYDPHPRPRAAAALGFDYVSLPELLCRAHVISLHATLTPESLHILDHDAFAQCRRGVVIINTARGRLIDTEALLAALDEGIVAGVGLDVLEDERVLRERWSRIISGEIVQKLRDPFLPLEPRGVSPERIKSLKALVHNEALLARPNVIFTPHIAFNSVEAIERIDHVTVYNIEAFLRGRPINVVAPQQTAEAGVDAALCPAGASSPRDREPAFA